jgi:hypothetical protein
MAHHRQAQRAQKHHAHLPAFALARTKLGRECLVISPSELALNSVFENYDAIIGAACVAWRKLTAQPERITSIGIELGRYRSAVMTFGISRVPRQTFGTFRRVRKWEASATDLTAVGQRAPQRPGHQAR